MTMILYKVTKTGDMQQWQAWVEGSKVRSLYGKEGGKQIGSVVTCEGKNIGRANETTPEEQAAKELVAMYNFQIKNKHYRQCKREAESLVDECKVPMKLLNYKDHSNKVVYPCLVSVKLNGSRAMFKDGEVISKAGIVENFKVQHIKDQVSQLSMDVDGEVYRHGWPLQRIQSARNKPNEDTEELNLHIFDVPIKGVPVEEREKMLGLLEEEIREKGLKNLHVLRKDTIHSPEELMAYRDDLVSKRYEGIVAYNYGGMYEFGVRSDQVFKSKPRYDAEAKVVSVDKDKRGNGILHCVAADVLGGVKFKCVMKVDRRDGVSYPKDYDSMCKLIGQWITFSYEELSSKGVPTKPVGEVVRKCNDKGEPLE